MLNDSIQKYLLSIVTIVIVSVIVELLIPSGKITSYVRSVLAIFIFFVVVNPIVVFFKSDIDISNLSLKQEYVDNEFVKKLNNSKVSNNKNLLIKQINETCNIDASVEIGYVLQNNTLTIENVDIFIENEGYFADGNHIDVKDKIVTLTTNLFDVSKENVNIYG